MYYNGLTQEQVITVYTLFKFLRRLRVIGKLDAHTVRNDEPVVNEFDIIDTTGADYAIVKDRYSSEKSDILVEELLEKLFGRVQTHHYYSSSY